MKTYGKVSYDVVGTIGNYALTQKRRAVIKEVDLWQIEGRCADPLIYFAEHKFLTFEKYET